MTIEDSPFLRHFSIMPDPRVQRGQKHLLTDLIAIAIIAALCGIDSFQGIALFAEARLDWLKQFLALPGGAPSHDTFSRVFARIKPQHFQECFTAWMAEITTLTAGEVIAIDGKTLRRSFDRAAEKSAIHMVSAWATANGVCLGQIKVDDKSNEITAVPKLLETLCLKGCLVTLDAMGCQREIAQQIIDGEADYTIALKGNQSSLHTDVQQALSAAITANSEDILTLKMTEESHGREEVRRYFVMPAPDKLLFDHDWPGLTSIGMVKSTRIIKGQATYEDRYFISSLAADAEKFAKGVREHWRVENSLHWVLDVSYNDDGSTVRKGHGAENLSTIRRIALNMLKKEPRKASIPGKQILCSHNEKYLFKVLIS